MTTIETIIGGEEVGLRPERAICWPGRRTLLIADLHLGKASTFRASGIPVPEEVTRADLERLSRIVDTTGAERLVILGDLLHARAGRSEATLGAFSGWRRRYASLDILLVRGNHDESAGDPPGEWKVRCAEAPVVDGPFVYAHEPMSDARGVVLCGHVHPAAVLHGAARSSLRSACFWVREQERMCVLPAFGSFTGMRAVRAKKGDRVFVVGEDHVVEVKRGGAVFGTC